MMKTKTLAFISMLGIAGTFASCSASSDELGKPESVSEGKGTFKLNLTANADFSEQTRALNEDTYRNPDNYTVKLLNASNGNELLSCRGSEIASNLPKELEIGSYEIQAFYGTEYDANRNDFRVEGSTTFSIQAKDEKTINLTCEPTCGKVSVVFNNEMNTYYSDYSMTFSGTKKLGTKTFSWARSDNEPWYIALDAAGETINYELNLTIKDEYIKTESDGKTEKQGQVTGSFSLERNKAHKITVTPQYTPTTEGALSIKITIDDSTNDKPITIEVPVTWI